MAARRVRLRDRPRAGRRARGADADRRRRPLLGLGRPGEIRRRRRHSALGGHLPTAAHVRLRRLRPLRRRPLRPEGRAHLHDLERAQPSALLALGPRRGRLRANASRRLHGREVGEPGGDGPPGRALEERLRLPRGRLPRRRRRLLRRGRRAALHLRGRPDRLLERRPRLGGSEPDLEQRLPGHPGSSGLHGRLRRRGQGRLAHRVRLLDDDAGRRRLGRHAGRLPRQVLSLHRALPLGQDPVLVRGPQQPVLRRPGRVRGALRPRDHGVGPQAELLGSARVRARPPDDGPRRAPEGAAAHHLLGIRSGHASAGASRSRRARPGVSPPPRVPPAARSSSSGERRAAGSSSPGSAPARPAPSA